MSLYRDEGVVLRTYRLGEADRIIVLLTVGHGKVRAVAKGVRKTKSRFGSRLEPPTHVSLLMYEGRELDIVTQAETIDHFRPIREDLARMTDAMAMLEVVDQVAQEREANPPLSRMLVGALQTLADRRSPLLVPAFFWKLLALEGAAPILDRCAGCGRAGCGTAATDDAADLVAFDLVEGGALCRDCRQGTAVSPEALALMRRILGGGLNQALAEAPSRATTEVTSLATHALEQHVERRLRALRALELG
ncbi:MAG TPA: DNA repair protein RecO [Acidimicrobiales bacterium]|nr:DNA repair protein RecO [Acidimicrobiales bacterium]